MASKIGEYLDIKSWHVFGKLGLEWEDEILNTRENSIVN